MKSHLRRKIIEELSPLLKGTITTNKVSRLLYATDASAYREIPLAVIFPRDDKDIEMVVKFSYKNQIPIIPRAAGTSLAGQVVGEGIIVDVSRYMNKIIEVDDINQWVKVMPGVILDELNLHLKKYGLYFGPETSTANRCNIGGMVGNNSCGSHSLLYGNTRDHLLEVEGFLSNGEKVIFKEMQSGEFEEKCLGNNLENHIYREINNLLSNKINTAHIKDYFPHPQIKRRNTGYAIDELIKMHPFSENGSHFNLSKLIAGSEGTLLFITSIKINLVSCPPTSTSLICAQFESLHEALSANLIAIKHKADAIELIDKNVLELTKNNYIQRKNRFFIKGTPAALLIIEFSRNNEEKLVSDIKSLIDDLTKSNLGYTYPIITGKNIKKVWDLRKAGLGVLSNMKGDAKPVSVIEDTAIRPEDLSNYVEEMEAMMEHFGINCIFHGHAGAGELHLRPILNLKKPNDVGLFRKIAFETAKVVKRYRGSLSGEHGDGRLRGEFVPMMVGNLNYKMFIRIKEAFDPKEIFNPGKIIDAPPMNSSLRYQSADMKKTFSPFFDWSASGGMLRAAEKCNGSGDCRKTQITGGTMCPSYMATHEEKHSTRGRANILREFFTGKTAEEQLYLDEVCDVLDLCLSCKACSAECPSSVDISKLKAEFLQYYYSQKGIPIRAKILTQMPNIYNIAAFGPSLSNLLIKNKTFYKIISNLIGTTPQRHLPTLQGTSLKRKLRKHKSAPKPGWTVYFFADEITNFCDSKIGFKTILLLEKLGYRVVIPQHYESGRIHISKGFMKKAKKIANRNIAQIGNLVSHTHPIIGIEPSAILTLRDEYPLLAMPELKKTAEHLAASTFTFEEFFSREIDKGRITSDAFTSKKKKVRFHSHCYQKALSNTNLTKKILSFPENYTAEEINSGCCGMAGTFGYEKEHYNISMKIGELILLPEVRSTPADNILSTSGSSCRNQIKDGTGKEALHPAEILYDALRF